MKTYESGGKDIRFELFEPNTIAGQPAIVILPGTFGMLSPWGDDIRTFAKGLQSAGIVAFIPNYFDRTGTQPGMETTAAITRLVKDHGDEWNMAIEDGITLVSGLPSVDSDRIGLLGFSLGGNRALTLAMKPRRVVKIKRIVEFFGPTVSIPLSGDVAQLPPLQIHHGDETDVIVHPGETDALINRLKGTGKTEGTDFVVHRYKGAGHGFQGKDLDDARKRTLEFFKNGL
ncbi:dienelactone hydrolase family protein [Methylocaldum gracile]|jgi:dienelactone hydrolase|uniref:dienelactone hydrolase family protein n=1 Tax=Methylocaldum sp. 0917 TaxID=2485163 RepID=UPI001061969C